MVLSESQEWWMYARKEAQRQRESGKAKQFRFNGYPVIEYFEMDHPHLNHHLGATAVPIFRQNYQFGSPDKHYIIVNKNNTPFVKLAGVVHEYAELKTRSHRLALQEEKKFAVRSGKLSQYYKFKLSMARRVSRELTGTSEIDMQNGKLMKQILRETGLTLEELRKFSRGKQKPTPRRKVPQVRKARLHV